ncbi:hypothetical protein [Aquimarina litoralis]|uniref:hypothetical protein n=1 Tax=Aquimarina litoralis TaxID=584605 RepID=UPI001C576F1E|nr:hypothetical protein [Aquimarina litoralis]MBW1294720.1 hypothetical protein [Aquimarina litoralis]
MGGEGSMMQAIVSLKNNRRQRNKRDVFSHINGNTDTQSQGIKVEPVSEETLQEIREKLKQQRQVLFRKRLVVFGIIIALITSILMYLI